MKLTVRLILPPMLLLLSACATTTPPTAVHQPMSVQPHTRVAAPPANGSIFNATSARPLFEDRRARHVGDTLTVNIAEKTAADKRSSSSADRSFETELDIPLISGLPLKSAQGAALKGGSSTSFEGAGGNAASNNFTGTVTVTVIDVYPNGNLLVSGEKQIGLKEGEEFIRFSGVVNPTTVTAANTVQSTQVADARIEYRGNGALDSAQQMGWLARFFLNILPF